MNYVQLERLNKCLIDWNVNYSVYPYGGYTINEILCQFFDAINKSVDVVNEYTKMVGALKEWIETEGLKNEVNMALDKMVEDGTLDKIINQKLFEELNENVGENSFNIKALRMRFDEHKEQNERDFEKIDGHLNMLRNIVNGNKSEFDDFVGETNKSFNNINRALAIQKGVVVFLNEYGNYAKEGTEEEDWSLAFNYVFENVVKDTVATIIWNGRLKVKSTINLPKHVNIAGVGLPWSGLTPTSDFNGEWLITDLNVPTHNSVKNIYMDFANNKNLKGIKVLNPYDYNEYKFLVADGIGDTFMSIGGTDISQSTRIEDCVAYRENMGTGAIVELRNCQEFFLENNKFLYKNQGNHECVWCDGVTNTTFIHNSFAFTNETALKLLATNYPKRLNGNVIQDNLFEGIGTNGCVSIIGSTDSNLEGSYNTIINNSYFSSTAIINLGHIANTYICDPVKINQLGGDRRTYLFNKYNATSSTVNGNVEEWTDGAYKITKSWFKIIPTDGETHSYFYMTDEGGKERTVTITSEGQFKIV